MVVNQVYQVVNSLQSQLFGTTGITVTDTTGLRALGDQIGAGNMYDKFCGVLVDRIGKTIVRLLPSKVEFPALLRNEFQFACILQKLSINLPDADENTAWNIADPSFTPDQFDVSVPDVKAVHFKGTSTFRVRVTIPDSPMLDSAFNSAETMNAFITALTDSMEKSMVEKLNAVSKAAICTLFAEKADAASASVINVLTLYNASHTPTLTADQCVESPEFQRWLSNFCGNVISYMDTPSELYCEAFSDGTKVARRTSRENMHVWINSQIANGNRAFMQSDTFWKDLVALSGDRYREVKMWQGSGTTAIPSFADSSTIHVVTKSGDDVEMNYVIAAFVDREAVAVCKYQLKTASDRNNINGYTNLASLANIMYAVDLTENAVILTLADPTITPPTP